MKKSERFERGKVIKIMDNLNLKNIKGYNVQIVAENVYAFDEFGVDMMYLVVGSDKAMLVDTGSGLGPLKAAVSELTDKPVFVANTHGHVDHTMGNYEFDEIYLNEKDVEMMQPNHFTEQDWKNFCEKTMKEPYYTGGDLTGVTLKEQKYSHNLEEGMRFDLGDRQFEAIGISGHTPGGMVFLDSKNRILISGDSIVSTPILIFNEWATSVSAFYRDLKKLAERENEFDLILPGHFLRPIGKRYLFDLIACAEDILEGKAKPCPVDMSHMSSEKAVSYKKGLSTIIYNEKHIG